MRPIHRSIRVTSGEKEGEERREGQWNENGARKKERGDDESCEDDRPDADERIGGGGFAFWRVHVRWD